MKIRMVLVIADFLLIKQQTVCAQQTPFVPKFLKQFNLL
jgi:hypothetical protein